METLGKLSSTMTEFDIPKFLSLAQQSGYTLKELGHIGGKSTSYVTTSISRGAIAKSFLELVELKTELPFRSCSIISSKPALIMDKSSKVVDLSADELAELIYTAVKRALEV